MPAPVRLTDPARPAEVQHELERPERLAALHGTGLLDTEPEEAFDRWTRVASGQQFVVRAWRTR